MRLFTKLSNFKYCLLIVLNLYSFLFTYYDARIHASNGNWRFACGPQKKAWIEHVWCFIISLLKCLILIGYKCKTYSRDKIQRQTKTGMKATAASVLFPLTTISRKIGHTKEKDDGWHMKIIFRKAMDLISVTFIVLHNCHMLQSNKHVHVYLVKYTLPD